MTKIDMETKIRSAIINKILTSSLLLLSMGVIVGIEKLEGDGFVEFKVGFSVGTTEIDGVGVEVSIFSDLFVGTGVVSIVVELDDDGVGEGVFLVKPFPNSTPFPTCDKTLEISCDNTKDVIRIQIKNRFLFMFLPPKKLLFLS